MKTLTLALLATLAAACSAQSPFATQVVASTGLAADGDYNDPAALLGKPTTHFGNPYGNDRKSLATGSYGLGPTGNRLITSIRQDQSVTVRFDHLVTDDAANPFGLDFIVFGNSFLVGNGFADDTTNLNAYTLDGTVYGPAMKVSVSPDNVNWFTYEGGPYANTLMPTNAYAWDRTSASWTDREMDWTKPVDPSLSSLNLAGRSAADVLDLYKGSAGGTGFDLRGTGFSAIQYIRVTGVSGFANGALDGFADVAPTAVPEPATFAAFGLGAWALLRRRRK